jgi:membrane protease YdiL (CAAX protease family)
MRDEDDDAELPHAGRPMSFLAASAWTIAAGLVSQIVVAITDAARPGAEGDLVNLTACIVLAYSVLIFGILRVYAPEASLRDVLGVRATSPWALLLSIAGGVALYPALDVIDDFINKRFPISADETERLDKLMQAATIRERVVLGVSLVVALPLFEELFYRGALFRGLRRARPEGLAVLTSAAFYAMSRGDLRGLPTAFVLGLFVGWLRGRSGSIAPSIAAHAAYNALPLVPIVLLGRKEEMTFGPKYAIGGAIAAAVCAWGAGMVYARGAQLCEVNSGSMSTNCTAPLRR